MDWQTEVGRVRPSISANTTPDELFSALAGLIRPLEDGHCSLRGLGRRAGSGAPDPDADGSRRRAECRNLVDAEYLAGAPDRACEGRLSWGWLTDEIAYLRLDAMEGLAPSGDYEEGLAALDLGLDRAFEALTGLRGLSRCPSEFPCAADPFPRSACSSEAP